MGSHGTTISATIALHLSLPALAHIRRWLREVRGSPVADRLLAICDCPARGLRQNSSLRNFGKLSTVANVFAAYENIVVGSMCAT